MKMMLKPMLFLFLITLTCLSCNNEELFVEPTADVVDPDVPVDTEDPVEDPDNTSDPVDTTLPCMFTLSTVQAGDTVIINCMMDLEGQTITLPANVTLVYEGGDIINGTLIFSENNVISGELLNAGLSLGGATPLLKDTTFNFDPQRWGIVEGETTSEIAQRNNNILEGMFIKVKNMGVSTFKIDKMDAYFEVSKVTSTTTNQNFYPELEAVNIPSDFNLEMTDNTILRVYPTEGKIAASLLAISQASNVTVTGGVLFGDRDLRTYSKANAEEGSHLLTIRSGKNVVLDGITFTMGSVGGLNVNSYGFSFNPDYDPTNNIIVKNCLFKKVRMISFAITDGYNILVENNTFIDTAQPTQNSDGGVVGYAMDLEPVRDRDSNGELRFYQRVYDVTIRNNKEIGSRIGAFTIYAGDNIIIEDNELESVVGWSYASNSKVRNNTFLDTDNLNNTTAILASGSGETVFNNEISGNIIKGFKTGITAYTGKMKIYDNTIIDFVNGIFLNDIKNTQIYNNNIKSSIANSRGITFQLTSADNILIENNQIDVKTLSLNFVGLNQGVGEENYNVTVDNNSFISNTSICNFSDTKGVIIKNNESSGRFQLYNASNLNILNNTISSISSDGIILRGINNQINISSNIINFPENYSCINIYETTDINQILLFENSCN